MTKLEQLTTLILIFGIIGVMGLKTIEHKGLIADELAHGMQVDKFVNGRQQRQKDSDRNQV